MLQKICYKENPTDIPNPDRGFYRAQECIVPVESGSHPGTPDLSATIVGTTVSVETRIVYMGFCLRNFSSNSPLDGLPLGPWSKEGDSIPNYGTTMPLTDAALEFIRTALLQIRESQAVCILKFQYDVRGYTYNNRQGYDQFLHDCEPGAPEGRLWYESGGRNGGKREESDLCGIPGHEDKNWIQYHLWQLSSVFSEFQDIIMCVKGGFFGPWGEMHSSSYARTAKGYHWLLSALLKYVPKSRSIQVHAGGVMAWHNIEYGTSYNFQNPMPKPARGTPAQRFGMFNDSYSAGSRDFSDHSSLSEGLQLIGGDYCRNAALSWIRNQNNFYGGETVGSGDEDNIYPRFPNVPYEAAYARTIHLNANYSPRTYFLWGDFVYNEANMTAPFTPPHDNITRTANFDPVYDGRSGMVFMRDRLGFRLVLRESYLDEIKNGNLKFKGKIQNVGFGNIINEKKVTVILMPKAHAQMGWGGLRLISVEVDIDPRDWTVDENGNNRPDNTAAWRDISFDINLGKAEPGLYNVFLKINDPNEKSKNKRCIQFANYDIWNVELGANLLGTVLYS